MTPSEFEVRYSLFITEKIVLSPHNLVHKIASIFGNFDFKVIFKAFNKTTLLQINDKRPNQNFCVIYNI